ncbi:unnamed protein product [Nezara viridula]|uniref:Immunoglobulin-like beta-sandwich domain-containing protein n=1 Tax=Nezara viridula TaxID=85310 RepID=A0A9P0HRT9_NEZVI|nr:unnamed protein product [Nezara viridula]
MRRQRTEGVNQATPPRERRDDVALLGPSYKRRPRDDSWTVGWLKAEDQTVLTLHTKVVTHNARISVSHDNERVWRLHIRQLRETDRGCYMCQINTSIMKKQIGCIDVHVDQLLIWANTIFFRDRCKWISTYDRAELRYFGSKYKGSKDNDGNRRRGR